MWTDISITESWAEDGEDNSECEKFHIVKYLLLFVRTRDDLIQMFQLRIFIQLFSFPPRLIITLDNSLKIFFDLFSDVGWSVSRLFNTYDLKI